MAEQHFNYLYPLIKNPDLQEWSVAIALGGALALLGKAAASRLRTADGIESGVIPEERTSLFGFFDLFTELFVSYHDSILGKENRRYVSFSASIFLFLLSANLIGLVPGMPAITTTVWLNVGVALLVFVYFNYVGIKVNGFWNYLKHFCGPVWWLAWFIFPLEIASSLLRILTLNLRLYWNIEADHIVLHTFTNLLPNVGLSAGFFAGLPFYVLGTFVSFMQAFVFTTLSMVYILLASHHEEGEHH